jgi:hypothetical protein
MPAGVIYSLLAHNRSQAILTASELFPGFLRIEEEGEW